MNALGVLAHLAADHPLREGMVGVARDTRETAILDGDDEAAGGRAVVRTDGQHAAFKGIMATAMIPLNAACCPPVLTTARPPAASSSPSRMAVSRVSRATPTIPSRRG